MKHAAQHTIRVARADDEPEIRRCVGAAYSPYVERIGKPPAPMLDDYAELIGRGVVRVATRGDRLDGMLVMWSERDHLYVDNVAVRPDAQGNGVGAALLIEAEQEARRSGHDEIRLYTNAAMVENLEYYSRKGFCETHRSMDGGYARIHFSRQLEEQRSR